MNKVIIKKEDLRHNIDRIKKYINESVNNNDRAVKIIAVVKGNAYGLGIIEFTEFLIDNGISLFAVATVEEAMKLRNAGIKKEIILLTSTTIREDIEKLIENDIVLTIGSKEDIEVIENIAEQKNKKVKCHLKIDTGFGRYGFVYTDKEQIIKNLKELKNIEIKGTFSHYSNSYYDAKYTKIQFNRFMDVIEKLKENQIETGMLHICNTSATLQYKEQFLNAVRIGSGFLGRLSMKNSIGLKKIAYLESQVTEIKELPKDFNVGYSNTFKTNKKTKVAIIPCGYMNGINISTDKDMFRLVDRLRELKSSIKAIFTKQNRYVEINKQKCKIIGKIATYHVVCDITEKNINIGDKAIFQISPKFVDSDIRREYI